MIGSIAVEFLLAAAVLATLLVEALLRLHRPWSRPAVAVYLTVAAWYLMDYLYNGPERFAAQFSDQVIRLAFFQVCLFLIAFRLWVQLFTFRMPSQSGRFEPVPRANLWPLFGGLAASAVALSFGGLWYSGGDLMNLIYPPAAEEHMALWARGGVGQGGDFLVSAAGYTHVAVVAVIGVLAVYSPDPRLRAVALLLFALLLPPFLFQRAQNQVLAVVAPALFAFLINRRLPVSVRVGGGVAAFLAINVWFLIIATYRGSGTDWKQVDYDVMWNGGMAKQHDGLDMLTELCHITAFIDSGHFTPNWGERYFAEVVAVVPRTVWPDKPFIGIDYAIARGFGDSRGAAGVIATVATGMIGQGVVNFGGSSARSRRRCWRQCGRRYWPACGRGGRCSSACACSPSASASPSTWGGTSPCWCCSRSCSGGSG